MLLVLGFLRRREGGLQDGDAVAGKVFDFLVPAGGLEVRVAP